MRTKTPVNVTVCFLLSPARYGVKGGREVAASRLKCGNNAHRHAKARTKEVVSGTCRLYRIASRLTSSSQRTTHLENAKWKRQNDTLRKFQLLALARLRSFWK